LDLRGYVTRMVNCMLRSLEINILCQLLGRAVGRVASTVVIKKSIHSSQKIWRVRGHLRDLGIDGRIVKFF
jgi:hypothetical protein